MRTVIIVRIVFRAPCAIAHHLIKGGIKLLIAIRLFLMRQSGTAMRAERICACDRSLAAGAADRAGDSAYTLFHLLYVDKRCGYLLGYRRALVYRLLCTYCVDIFSERTVQLVEMRFFLCQLKFK